MSQNNISFPSMVRIWLSHKIVLSYKSNHYKSAEVSSSLNFCMDIAKMVKANCGGYDTRRISRMILTHEKHLRNILPNPNNDSYKRQAEKLEFIISTAKTNLR